MFDEKVSVEHYKLLKFPTSSHLLIALDHFQSKLNFLLVMVVNAVIANAVVPANDAPGVIVRAVPLSVISISIISPSFGVPLRLVVNDVIFAASPVIVNISPLSVLYVRRCPCGHCYVSFCVALVSRSLCVRCAFYRPRRRGLCRPRI